MGKTKEDGIFWSNGIWGITSRAVLIAQPQIVKDTFLDRINFTILFFGIISSLGQISLLLFSWNKLPPQVPIFYSRAWGEQMLASPFVLWILPVITIFSLILNFLLAIFLKKIGQFVNRVLTVTCFFIALLTLYNLSKIIALLT